MSMNPSEKIARHWLSVLELAQMLGNVSVAWRQRGMTRTQFYDYKRRFELQGLEGLKDLSPIHKTHPLSPHVQSARGRRLPRARRPPPRDMAPA